MKVPVVFRPYIAQLLSLSLLLGGCTSGIGTAHPGERQAKAMAMWQERCKTAGEKIYKTAEGVEGLYLMKLRSSQINFGDQFKLDDPYGRDLGGNGYIQSFIRGSYQAENKNLPEGGPPRFGYSYVEVQDLTNGQRYRYTGAVKAVRKKDIAAPGVQFELQRDPNYDLGIYEFVLDRIPAPNLNTRYGVTYDDISTREEREFWIAGSSLKVIDLHTNEVIAERIGYMVDSLQGSQAGGRSPWLLATGNACPSFLRNYRVFRSTASPPSQTYQTLDFVEKVLKPSK